MSDENTLAVPDRRGNNRIDSLRNLIIDPRVALLFLIPGVAGKMLAEISGGKVDGDQHDRMAPERMKATIY